MTHDITLPLPTREQATAMAREAKGALKDLFNVRADHNRCLSLVARLHGHVSKEALLAATGTPVKSAPAITPATIPPAPFSEIPLYAHHLTALYQSPSEADEVLCTAITDRDEKVFETDGNPGNIIAWVPTEEGAPEVLGISAQEYANLLAAAPRMANVLHALVAAARGVPRDVLETSGLFDVVEDARVTLMLAGVETSKSMPGEPVAPPQATFTGKVRTFRDASPAMQHLYETAMQVVVKLSTAGQDIGRLGVMTQAMDRFGDARTASEKVDAAAEMADAAVAAIARLEKQGFATRGFWSNLLDAAIAVRGETRDSYKVPKVNDIVIDLVVAGEIGVVLEVYTNHMDHPEGERLATVRFGDGPDQIVRDCSLPDLRVIGHEVPGTVEWDVMVRATVRGDTSFLSDYAIPEPWVSTDITKGVGGDEFISRLWLEASVRVTAATYEEAVSEAIDQAPSTGVPHDRGDVEDMWVESGEAMRVKPLEDLRQPPAHTEAFPLKEDTQPKPPRYRGLTVEDLTVARDRHAWVLHNIDRFQVVTGSDMHIAIRLGDGELISVRAPIRNRTEFSAKIMEACEADPRVARQIDDARFKPIDGALGLLHRDLSIHLVSGEDYDHDGAVLRNASGADLGYEPKPDHVYQTGPYEIDAMRRHGETVRSSDAAKLLMHDSIPEAFTRAIKDYLDLYLKTDIPVIE